jgi:hypothetical protein
VCFYSNPSLLGSGVAEPHVCVPRATISSWLTLQERVDIRLAMFALGHIPCMQYRNLIGGDAWMRAGVN